MPEISQAELDLLQKSKKLLDQFWNDPEEGLAFKRKMKKFMPDASIPELEVADSVVKPLTEQLARQADENKALRERLDGWEKKQKDSQEESDLAKSLETVKSKFHFTDEGMNKVIARMKEKSNPDAEAAAAWVASQEKKAAPIQGSGLSHTNLNLYGSNEADESWKDLNMNPEKWMVKEAEKIMGEFAEQEAA
jgi:hypothetical protein